MEPVAAVEIDSLTKEGFSLRRACGHRHVVLYADVVPEEDESIGRVIIPRHCPVCVVAGKPG